MIPHTFDPIFSSWHCIWAKAGDSVSFTLELKLKLTKQSERVYVRMLSENSRYILKKNHSETAVFWGNSRRWLQHIRVCDSLGDGSHRRFIQWHIWFRGGKVSQPASLKFLKTRWQGHPIQALASTRAKTQALKARWQGHPLQALVDTPATTQALKARWQGHLLQALVEILTKTQATDELASRLGAKSGLGCSACQPISTPCGVSSPAAGLKWNGKVEEASDAMQVQSNFSQTNVDMCKMKVQIWWDVVSIHPAQIWHTRMKLYPARPVPWLRDWLAAAGVSRPAFQLSKQLGGHPSQAHEQRLLQRHRPQHPPQQRQLTTTCSTASDLCFLRALGPVLSAATQWPSGKSHAFWRTSKCDHFLKMQN